MKITEIVDAKLNSLPLGYVFTYNDFDVEVKQKNAVLKYLTRLAGSNKIMKLSEILEQLNIFATTIVAIKNIAKSKRELPERWRMKVDKIE